MQPAHSFHGLEIAVRSLSGARALRIVHPAGQLIPAHRHDWPLLTFPTLGGYAEEGEEGFVAVSGPAVVLHPAGRCHANCIHERGMETFSVEFDPDWLTWGTGQLSIDRSYYWLGGRVALSAKPLIRLWGDRDTGDEVLRQETAKFLQVALAARSEERPGWFAAVQHRLSSETLGADDLARDTGLHPRWLAHAYRQLAGEGLHETIVRQRVERAIHLLREGGQPIAEVALDSGFCDQSHLSRALRRLVGRTPGQIRAERAQLAALMAA